MSHYSELTSASARRGSRRGNGREGGESDASDAAYSEDLGRSYEETMEWDNIGIFGVGLAVGLVLGAGLALLLAPQSGEETREYLGQRSRWMTDRVSGGLGNVRENVERATRRSRRKLRRGLTRGRWMVEDLKR